MCDRCADRRVAALTGFPELPEPPLPITLIGPDRRSHAFAFRVWRAPTGIELELEETGVPVGEGYHFAALGAHDGDVSDLVEHVRRSAEVAISCLHLKGDAHRPGWSAVRGEIAGRLTWSDAHATGTPYNAIVDGRTLSWDDLGRALGSFEGFRFRIVIDDPCDDLRPNAAIIPLTKEPIALTASHAPTTIDEVFTDFLADQEKRLAPRTFGSYADVIMLLGHCLNGYGHQWLDDAERARWEAAYEGGDEEAFIHVFGPDKIADNLGDFLGDFMVRKVMASEDLLRSAGTVTKKLAKWLGERGYLDADTVAIAVNRGSDAARDLPKAERLSRLLYEQAEATTIDARGLADIDVIEDYLMILKVECGALWFEGGIGPVKVSKAITDLAQEGWSVNLTLGRKAKIWHILTVGNVYP